MEGYKEAKRILEENCGREIKVHKKLIMELENLRETMNTNQVKEHMNFTTSCRQWTLTTMKKINTAEAHVYSVMNELGPVRDARTLTERYKRALQKDANWENWGLIT